MEWEKYWLESHGAVVAATPQESARRAWPEKARRWAAGKRQLIEGVIEQFKDIFALERHWAKTLGGLLTPSGCEGYRLHRRTGTQRSTRETHPPFGESFDLSNYSANVLELEDYPARCIVASLTGAATTPTEQ